MQIKLKVTFLNSNIYKVNKIFCLNQSTFIITSIKLQNEYNGVTEQYWPLNNSQSLFGLTRFPFHSQVSIAFSPVESKNVYIGTEKTIDNIHILLPNPDSASASTQLSLVGYIIAVK